MSNQCKLRISRADFDTVIKHLFPGDRDEHGAVLLAGMSEANGQITFLVKEVHLAREGVDYVAGKVGYRALTPQFIHRMITRARDTSLVYLAIHNHDCDKEVNFSSVDFDSHALGYPALLQINRGVPVGALVFGRRSIEADVWLKNGKRLTLEEAIIVGSTIERLTPGVKKKILENDEAYDRQIKMFGQEGQATLAICQVAIIGLGGIGSLVAEYLARLGVGRFLLIDDDIVEKSNLSRIVGASYDDVEEKRHKVEVAKRVILQANPNAVVNVIVDDVSKQSAAANLVACDYVFLAADSMRARLVFNALVHQYLIPGVQLGSKIRSNPEGALLDVMSANRPVRPGLGCLWCNQLIDPTALAKEAKSDAERKAQAYGAEEDNPSVISINAVSAAHAVNDFLLDYLALRPEASEHYYEHFHHLKHARNFVMPRKETGCSECSQMDGRYALGDAIELPCSYG
ncbi:MAG: ThiF family adenylyltransferase [Burkholderiaceae bacterium]